MTPTTPEGGVVRPGWTGGLALVTCEDLKSVKGLPMPSAVAFRQIVATGPPGAGKSHFIRRLGGWPEEGYIDLTLPRWWRAQPLALRPREVNLGFPFVGHENALAVFDEDWLRAPEPLRIDPARIVFPPGRAHFFSPNWRARYAFFFLVPPPEKVLAGRRSRTREGVHPVDASVSIEEVERQLAIFREAALLFHRAAMTTYLIDEFDGTPKYLSAPGDSARETSVET